MSTPRTSEIAPRQDQQPSSGPARPTVIRADIQGLRALAVLLVVAYHANVPGIRAGYVGVDVFFVISGFLITSHLLREARRTGRIRFARFYARRIRRLLPLALTVVVVTLAVSRLYDAPTRVIEVIKHAAFTTIYSINYRLAAEGVDYQQATAPPSPLQHYWSLAVEEQFYLLWPLLIVAALWAGRRWGTRAVPAVLVGVVALSLVASVALTASNPTLSYFALHTRAWELGAGALVALGAARAAAMPRRAAAGAAWVGFAAIFVSALVYSDETAFPGAAALLPVAGTTLVIAAGCGGQLPSITRMVGGRVVQTVATLSYGWYLWHWPVLLLYPLVLRTAGDRWLVDVGASLGALFLAHLTYRFVERPTQALWWGTRAWLTAGVTMSVATFALLVIVRVSLPPGVGTGPPVSAPPVEDVTQVQNALQVAMSVSTVPSNLSPDVWQAGDDVPTTSHDPGRCMASYADVEQGPCVYGDPDGARTVVLFGDSHMGQWQPAFDEAARGGAGSPGWKVINWTKASCPLPDRPVQRNNEPSSEYVECEQWRTVTFDRIASLKPDLVVVSQNDSISEEASSPREYAAGTLATVNRLRETGADVVYVLDNPKPDEDVPTCLSTHLDDASACEVDARGSAAPERRDLLHEALRSADVTIVDPARWVCRSGVCPAVVGNMLTYRDNGHVSATYSRWLAPLAENVLSRQAG